MNRADFQGLARIRIKEARSLLDRGLSDGAYYLAGYAIECALKACIAKKTGRYDFPPERKIVDQVYTHNLEVLLKAAGLETDWKRQIHGDRQFEVRWNIVKDWSEISRYSRNSEIQARDLYDAVTNRRYGVLRWLRQRW